MEIIRLKFSKTVAVLLIFCLCINSMAAIVSDNDGSAFITKAEFDSLKNDFQTQLDQYNTSIDAKIDDAIASYLAGIKTSTTETMNILTNDWTEISCFNGIWEPSFQYPDVSIIYAGGMANDFTWSSVWNKKFSMPFWRRYKYDRTNTNVNKSYRPLVTGNKETSQTTDMVWNGIANYYVESFESTLAFQIQGSGDLAGIESKSETKTLRFVNPCVYTMSGYVSGFKNSNSALSSQFKYKAASKDYWNSITLTNKTGRNNAAVELKTDSNNITKTYEHIIQYDGDTEWPVSNELFTKTFRAYSKNTIKTNAWMNQTTKTGYNRMLVGHGQNYQSAGYYQNHIQDTFFYYTNLSWNDTDEDNGIVPSIGMLASDQKASAIYQYEKDKKYIFDKKEVTVKKPKLQEGFPLFYAKKGTKITWKPYFKKGKKQDSSGNWVDDGDTQVGLSLSIGPFTNKFDLPSSGQLIQMTYNTSTTKSTTAYLDEEKENTVKFEMPVDGIVYAKWRQGGSGWTGRKWIKTLDLEKCNTWTYEKEK